MSQFSKDRELHIRISRKETELLDDIVKKVNAQRKEEGLDSPYTKSRAVRDALRVYSEEVSRNGNGGKK